MSLGLGLEYRLGLGLGYEIGSGLGLGWGLVGRGREGFFIKLNEIT